MESLANEGLRSYRPFYDSVKAKLGGRRGKLFVDEVQEIEGWEKALSSLLPEDAADIYVTGSNAKLLARSGARDPALLDRVAAYAFDKVGSILSSKRVSDSLRSDTLMVHPLVGEHYYAYSHSFRIILFAGIR